MVSALISGIVQGVAGNMETQRKEKAEAEMRINEMVKGNDMATEQLREKYRLATELEVEKAKAKAAAKDGDKQKLFEAFQRNYPEQMGSMNQDQFTSLLATVGNKPDKLGEAIRSGSFKGVPTAPSIDDIITGKSAPITPSTNSFMTADELKDKEARDALRRGRAEEHSAVFKTYAEDVKMGKPTPATAPFDTQTWSDPATGTNLGVPDSDKVKPFYQELKQSSLNLSKAAVDQVTDNDTGVELSDADRDRIAKGMAENLSVLTQPSAALRDLKGPQRQKLGGVNYIDMNAGEFMDKAKNDAGMYAQPPELRKVAALKLNAKIFATNVTEQQIIGEEGLSKEDFLEIKRLIPDETKLFKKLNSLGFKSDKMWDMVVSKRADPTVAKAIFKEFR